MSKLLLGAPPRHDALPLDETDMRLVLTWLAKVPDAALVPAQLMRRLLATLDAQRTVRRAQ